MAHHNQFRNLLHKNRLEAFKAWVAVDSRFRVMPPTGHPYEVFRMEVYDPAGSHPHMPFYLRERSEHVSIPEASTEYVREFIDSQPGHFNWHSMSDAQRAALELGQKIRNIVCMDSLAARFFEHDQRVAIRAQCDIAMSRLGYETLSAHRERLNNHFMSDTYVEMKKSFYKYQKVS